MSEEQTQNAENKSASSDANTGNNNAEVGFIERADNIVKRLEEAEKRIIEKTRQYELAVSKSMMSGRALGGIPQKTPQEIEKEKDEAEIKKILSRIGQ